MALPGVIDERELTGPKVADQFYDGLLVRMTVAKVWKTGLGAEQRNIYVESQALGKSTVEVRPVLDSFLKLPPPRKGEYVFLIVLNKWNDAQVYLPFNREFYEINNRGESVQIEAPEGGEVEIHGDQVLIGASATEHMILGDTLVDILGTLIDALSAETHTGNTGLPTSPPLNAATYQSIKEQLELAKAEIGRVR